MPREKKTIRCDQELQVAARGGAFGLIGMIGSRILTLFLYVAISRLFGIMFFGYFVTGVMLCQTLQVFSSMGLPIGSVRYFVQSMQYGSRQDMLRIYWICILETLIVGSIVSFLFYGAVPFLSNHIFKEPGLLPFLRIFAFVVPWLALLRVVSELSRSFGTVRYTVILEDIAFPLLQICALLWAITNMPDPLLAALAFLYATIICGVLMSLVVYRQIKRHIFINTGATKTNPPVGIWELIKYSLPLTPTGVIFMINNNIDIFMLNIFSNGVGVGIYAAATRWTILVDSLGVPIMAIFRPLIAKAISLNDTQMLRSLVMASARWVLYLILPFIAFLTAASQPAMMLFLKEDTLGIASNLLWILCVARLTNPLSNGAGLLLAIGGHQYKELFSIICGGITNIFLNVLLIPHYGVIGAAVATGAGLYVSTILRIYYVWQIWGMIPWNNRMIIPITALGIVMMIFMFVDSSVSPLLQFAGGGLAACFVGCSILFFAWEQDDKVIAHLMPAYVQNIFGRMVSVVTTLLSKMSHQQKN